MITQFTTSQDIIYPDSDGNPMSDNTEQYRWIVIIKENLEIIFAEDTNAFIAGDLLWYPVRGSLERFAPDVMVALGRPKGRRGSYKQWEEENIAPQIAFEILSPSNKDRRGEDSLEIKFRFYERYGIEEYYIYDPDDWTLAGWQRQAEKLEKIPQIGNWTSPRLGIRFDWEIGKELVIYRPNGERFLSSVELEQKLQWSERRVKSAEQIAKQERQRAEQEREKAEQERERANRLADRLRSLGINPDSED